MSNLLFPDLPGRGWTLGRSFEMRGQVEEAASGRDYARTLWTAPRRLYKLRFDVLRQGTIHGEALTDLEQLVGLHLRVGGTFDTFLFQDPDDHTVTAAAFGLGTGASSTYQLTRTWGGFVEPIYAPYGFTIYEAGTPLNSGSYTLGTDGAITLTAAAGAALTWSGSFRWRCRFVNNLLDTEQIMHALYSAQGVQFRTTKGGG